MLDKILEKLNQKEDFKSWNENNKLTNNGEPLLVFHGSFNAIENIKSIDMKRNNEGLHFSGGLYASNNINEINNYYAGEAIHNENTDVYHAIEEQTIFFVSQDRFDKFFQNINLDKISYLSDSQKEEILESYEKEELLDNLKEYLNEEDFFEIFNKNKDNIDELDLEDYEYVSEMINRLYIAHNGLVFPLLIKMENPLICIDKNIESIYKPTSLCYLGEVDLENILNDTDNAVLEFINKINDHYEAEIITKEDFSMYFSGLYFKDNILSITKNFVEDKLLNLDIDDDELDDIFLEIENELEEEYLFIEEEDKPEYLIAFENYKAIINSCIVHNVNTLEIRKAIEDIIEESDSDETCLYNVRDIIYKLKENNYEEYNEFIKKVIPDVYDGAVFNAHFEFDYVKENFDNNTYHYINYKSKNVKYLLNNTFSNEDNLMERKIDYVQAGHHIPITEIKDVIERFQKIYPNITKINISSFKDKVIANIDKTTGFINLYMENIKSKKELEKTLIHEYVVHYGLGEVLGEEADTLLKETYDHYKNTKDFEKTRNKYSEYKENTDEGRLKLAEEHLAYIAENQLYKKDKFAFNILYKLSLLFKKVKEALNIKSFENKLFIKIDNVDNHLKKQKRTI